MKPRTLPSIVEGELSDYEWQPAKTEMQTVQTPKVAPPVAVPPPPTTPSLPRMKISPTPISADELLKNLSDYYDSLAKVPNWQEELAKKNKAAKEAHREARRAQRRKAA